MQVIKERYKVSGRFPLRQEVDYPKVKAFLESRARKSWKTASTYMSCLLRFNKFVATVYPNANVESILPLLKNNDIDPYKLLDQLISHLQNKQECSANTVVLTFAAVSSYFQYHDVEINPSKFKNKCPLPSLRKEDEKPLDHADIRRILLGINSQKLRTYCLVLASGGARATEALAIRYKDVDLSQSPTKIYMRAEFAKNRLPREIYISDEATEYLKRRMKERKTSTPDDLVFATTATDPNEIYGRMSEDFRAVLKTIGMDERKGGKLNRHAYSFHSFRRFCETAVEDNTSLSYADYILGHKKSVYYNHKEPARRAIYKEKCMQSLTFLDYEKLDTHAKTIEQKVVKDEKILYNIQATMAQQAEQIAVMSKALKMLGQKDPEKLIFDVEEFEKNQAT